MKIILRDRYCCSLSRQYQMIPCARWIQQRYIIQQEIYSKKLAAMCKSLGIKFIFASSCSVYGVGKNDLLDESSNVNPQTGYSLNKYQIETDLEELSDSSFSPIALRFATVFGPSPKYEI